MLDSHFKISPAASIDRHEESHVVVAPAVFVDVPTPMMELVKQTP